MALYDDNYQENATQFFRSDLKYLPRSPHEKRIEARVAEDDVLHLN